jgi:DNA polymerase III subunit epsilon
VTLLSGLNGISFVVIDFEALTPPGRPAEPAEVAVIVVDVQDGQLVERSRFAELICPPADVPVTAFDTRTTGITAGMLTAARPAGQVLADLDECLAAPPVRLVAHHAPTEAGLIGRQRQHCPGLAAVSLLDTVRLARKFIPGLSSYRLDELLRYYGIGRPAGRHRAMPDVEVTAEVFRRLLADGAEFGAWGTITDLDAIAGFQPRISSPGPDIAQDRLF